MCAIIGGLASVKSLEPQFFERAHKSRPVGVFIGGEYVYTYINVYAMIYKRFMWRLDGIKILGF